MTVQAAIDAAPAAPEAPTVIRIPPGVYREKITVDRPVILMGEDAATTVITWDDHATQVENGQPIGTFATATLLVACDGFEARGITFENSAGPGERVGQAVAVYVDADRAVFRRCRFTGRQDTLFTAPLPPYPLTVKNFGGPREHLPRRQGRHYYEDCRIEGDVDFIFGSATAVFHRCDIVSLNRGTEPGWITAASTPEGSEHGYVFLDCRLTGDAAERTVYLGRPWRDDAKTVFVRCELGGHIHPQGWHDWDKPAARERVFYAEGASSGPGALGTRVSWSRGLSPDEMSALTPERILRGSDGWNPLVVR